MNNQTETSRRELQIDALNLCPPIGAMYAAFGIHACLPHSHGASGCCRFQRMELSKHFQKIVRVTSSMLQEPAAVFGGEENLQTSVNNIFRVYNPDIIAVHTTCLSETIGDDIKGIASRLEIPDDKRLVWATTPGYVGSQLTGYSAMTEAFIKQLSVPGEHHQKKLFLIPGLINPSDIEEIARYAALFFDKMTVFPDVRGIFDCKTLRNERTFLPAGTPVCDIAGAASCSDVIALGAEATFSAADALAGYGLSSEKLMLPIGLGATDALISALHKMSGRPVPQTLVLERARAVDVVMNLHPQLFGKRVALLCDADLSVGLTAFLAEIGMKPVCVCTGYGEERFADEIQAIFDRYQIEGYVNREADRYDLECYLNEHPVDLLMGSSRGKILARKFGIPLVRVGFPVIDRPLEYLTPVAGYRGCLHLIQKILCALAEHSERNTRAEDLHIAESF